MWQDDSEALPGKFDKVQGYDTLEGKDPETAEENGTVPDERRAGESERQVPLPQGQI